MSKIKLKHSSGNSMSIGAPATNPASDLELKLPATVGTANQFLKNSGTAGTLGWSSVTEDSGTVIIKNADGDSNGLRISQESSDESRIYNYYGGSLTFGVGNAEKMRLTTAGITVQGSQYMGENGTDTSPWNNDSSGERGWNWQDNIGVFSVINNSDYSAMYINKISAGGIVDYRFIDFRFDGSAVGKIWYTNNDVVLAQQSDYRLKENVVGITDGISRIKQLNPIKFNFKSDAPSKDPSILNEGFLAHELQAVIPQAAYGTKDGTKLNEEGQTVADYQEVYTPKMIPTLTAALKEAIAKIETLETKVAALEAA
tara:strand:+ start:841 stop:1782 length:942 start_codon:yes stop_codon:yes gene_type:complete